MNKFKVGDRVRLVNVNGLISYSFADAGSTGTINKVCPDGVHLIAWDGDAEFFCREERLELVEQEQPKQSNMKTIKQWFEETLPPEYANRAIRNTKPATLEASVRSIGSAISGAFCWEDSPEGHKFWEDVDIAYKPKLPPIPKTKDEELADFVVRASKDPFMPNDMNTEAIGLVKKYNLQ